MRAINAIWNYFKSMNSESTGGISIKRNVSLLLTLLLLFVEIYTCMKLVNKDIDKFISLAEFYSFLNATLILLVLGITSLEKISDLIQRIKGGLMGGNTPPTPAAAPEPAIKTEETTTES